MYMEQRNISGCVLHATGCHTYSIVGHMLFGVNVTLNWMIINNEKQDDTLQGWLNSVLLSSVYVLYYMHIRMRPN